MRSAAVVTQQLVRSLNDGLIRDLRCGGGQRLVESPRPDEWWESAARPWGKETGTGERRGSGVILSHGPDA